MIEWVWNVGGMVGYKQAKLKYSEENTSQCHVSYHKSHIDLPPIGRGFQL
jgi:hypothetical protein